MQRLAFRSEALFVPSAIHEALVSLFQQSPELAGQLLRDVLGLRLPAHAVVRTDTNTFSSLTPAEYRADALVLFEDAQGMPLLACIIEVQLSVNQAKPRDWLAYTATASRKLGCDACVLVFSPSARVARWAARPLCFGYGCTFQPLVIGPAQIPAITDPGQAKAAPHLAVLSAVAHGRNPDVDTTVAIASSAFEATVLLEDGGIYSDLIEASLSAAARKALEMLLPNYQFQTPAYQKSYEKGRTEGKAEGRAEGKATDILEILDARGIFVSEEQRQRVLTCKDLETLKLWVRQAATCATADELFTA